MNMPIGELLSKIIKSVLCNFFYLWQIATNSSNSGYISNSNGTKQKKYYENNRQQPPPAKASQRKIDFLWVFVFSIS